jgi:hypothetical protein
VSLPNIPDITPDIKLKRKDVIHLLLASIAQEELGLSHILNAEGEKLQHGICQSECFEDLLVLNRSVERMLKSIIKKEMLLLFKFDNVLELIDKECYECEKHHHHDGCGKYKTECDECYDDSDNGE